MGRNNPAATDVQQAIDALNGAASRVLNGVKIDVSEVTKLQDAVGSAEVAVSRQLDIIVAKDNVRSPQEDAAPDGTAKTVADYFKSLANQRP